MIRRIIMYYDKLVRDHIPSIIAESGKSCSWRVANKKERLPYLTKKILEEAHELVNAKSDEDILEELADLTEVIRALMIECDICCEALTDAQIEKKESKGGFDNFIILENVED